MTARCSSDGIPPAPSSPRAASPNQCSKNSAVRRRGPELLEGDGVLVAVVAEPVRHAGRDRDRLTGADLPLLSVDDEAEPSGHDLGAALLAGVEVQRLRGTGRRVDRIDPQQRALKRAPCAQYG